MHSHWISGKEKYLFLVCFLILLSSSGYAQLSIMSYNIRYDNPGDNENWWEKRKPDVAKLINYYHPDILGIQEGLHHQVEFLQDNTLNYEYIGIGRDDGYRKGEYSAIYYDKTKFNLIEQNSFWLSESPDKISVGWDASMERICTYGIFTVKNNHDTIYVFNTHFDHIGKTAREKSAELIVQKLQDIVTAGSKVILMGDLNCEPGSQPILKFNEYLEDGLRTSKNEFYGPLGTYNQFNPNYVPQKRIDYIFTLNLDVLSYRHIDDRRTNNLWVSDHLPVMIIAEYKDE